MVPRAGPEGCRGGRVSLLAAQGKPYTLVNSTPTSRLAFRLPGETGSSSRWDPSPYPSPQHQNAWVESERKNYALFGSAVSVPSESENRPGKIHSGVELRRRERIHLGPPGFPSLLFSSYRESCLYALRTLVSCPHWRPQKPCVGVSGPGPWYPGLVSSRPLYPGGTQERR